MKPHLTPDLLLFLSLLLIAGAIFALIFALQGDGSTVVVTVNGEVFAEESLSKNVEIDVDGLLTVVISDGTVFVEGSTCPGGLCEGMGEISKSGESIVCLPNGVVVKITADEPEYDFVN